MSMEISDRDKTLLYLVAAIVILFAAYFFGFRNFNDKKDGFKAETVSINDEYNRLIEYQKKRQEYVDMTKKYKEDEELVLAEYSNTYTQESLIKLITDMEKNDNVFVKDIAFVEPQNVYTFTYRPELTGMKSDMNISFEGKYEEFKKFVNDVLAIDSKTIISQMSVSWNATDEFVDASLAISYFAVNDINKEQEQTKIDIPIGLGNIFKSNSVANTSVTSVQNANYILSDYDISVVISQADADMDAVIVGTTNDSKAKDSLANDTNGTQDLTITVDGSEGKYTVSYKLGKDTYPAKKYEEGVNFKPGDTLDILVLSSARTGNDDKVSVRAEIVNNTDMPLNILVSGDDTSSPRFSVTKKVGDITIFR